MRLGKRAGGSGIGLRPLRYQFPVATGEPWDDNWLVIGAEVSTATGDWSFTDPCLVVDEARELSTWLRAVADGRRPDAAPDSEGNLVPDLDFTEPVLGFSQVRWHDGSGVLRVHLSREGAPPRRSQGGRPEAPRYAIEIETDRDALLRAAEEWDRDLTPFPPRSGGAQ
ncbi:hypothetical protein ACIP93_30735 [Streptomyces sp. NPDC088745]|uniref:WapI family immunity protein n=1 Tax=Streptomyces sp. NPDC088745 TaxID=3365884 RepID=UPI00382C2605